MRYYYYGEEACSKRKRAIHAMDVYDQFKLSNDDPKDRDLVIEEDTIYEIDRDCLRCKGNMK